MDPDMPIPLHVMHYISNIIRENYEIKYGENLLNLYNEGHYREFIELTFLSCCSYRRILEKYMPPWLIRKLYTKYNGILQHQGYEAHQVAPVPAMQNSDRYDDQFGYPPSPREPILEQPLPNGPYCPQQSLFFKSLNNFQTPPANYVPEARKATDLSQNGPHSIPKTYRLDRSPRNAPPQNAGYPHKPQMESSLVLSSYSSDGGEDDDDLPSSELTFSGSTSTLEEEAAGSSKCCNGPYQNIHYVVNRLMNDMMTVVQSLERERCHHDLHDHPYDSSVVVGSFPGSRNHANSGKSVGDFYPWEPEPERAVVRDVVYHLVDQVCSDRNTLPSSLYMQGCNTGTSSAHSFETHSYKHPSPSVKSMTTSSLTDDECSSMSQSSLNSPLHTTSRVGPPVNRCFTILPPPEEVPNSGSSSGSASTGSDDVECIDLDDGDEEDEVLPPGTFDEGATADTGQAQKVNEMLRFGERDVPCARPKSSPTIFGQDVSYRLTYDQVYDQRPREHRRSQDLEDEPPNLTRRTTLVGGGESHSRDEGWLKPPLLLSSLQTFLNSHKGLSLYAGPNPHTKPEEDLSLAACSTPPPPSLRALPQLGASFVLPRTNVVGPFETWPDHLSHPPRLDLGQPRRLYLENGPEEVGTSLYDHAEPPTSHGGEYPRTPHVFLKPSKLKGLIEDRPRASTTPNDNNPFGGTEWEPVFPKHFSLAQNDPTPTTVPCKRGAQSPLPWSKRRRASHLQSPSPFAQTPSLPSSFGTLARSMAHPSPSPTHNSLWGTDRKPSFPRLAPTLFPVTYVAPRSWGARERDGFNLWFDAKRGTNMVLGGRGRSKATPAKRSLTPRSLATFCPDRRYNLRTPARFISQASVDRHVNLKPPSTVPTEIRSPSVDSTKNLVPDNQTPFDRGSRENCELVRRRRQIKWKRQALVLLDRFYIIPGIDIFYQPVKQSRASDYGEVVRRPMDYATLRKSVKSGILTDDGPFFREIILIHMNAMMYNSEDHPIYKLNQRIWKEVNEHIKDYLLSLLFTIDSDDEGSD